MQPVGTESEPRPSGSGTGGGDGLNLRPVSRGTGDGRQPQRARASLGLTVLLAALLAAAVYFGRMSAPGAIAAAVFGGAALFFAERLVRSLDRGERASFESAWGGLGGGLGGWRLTTPLVYLVATALFGTLLMVVAVQEMPPGRASAAPVTTEKGKTEAPAAEQETEGQEGEAGEPAEPAAGGEDKVEPTGDRDSGDVVSEPEDNGESATPATDGAAVSPEGQSAAQP